MCPHIEYVNSIWYPNKIKDLKAIGNLQQHATKYVSPLKHLSYEERVHKLKLPNLHYRQLRGNMIETYKLMMGIYDKAVANRLSKQQDNSTSLPTREHSLKLFQQEQKRTLDTSLATM